MAAFTVIKENRDFQYIYRKGQTQVHPCLVTYLRCTRRPVTRVGITTGKKIGGAVQRNRCRRIIREAYRSLMPQVRGGFDIVFVARGRTVGSKSTDIARVMEEHLRQGGVIG
ncbi:MAG: ribonuclease P protein component [Acutalibacteraceae bacterium]|jgi:ribonuclease P protein component